MRLHMSVVVALIAFSEVCFVKEELVYRDQGDDPNFRNKSTCSDFIRRYRRHLPEAARSISKVDWASRENSGSSKQRALISLPIACRLDGGFSGNHFAGQRIANDDRRNGRWCRGIEMVGARGFEPRTPCAQGRCATRLRYAPTA
jgi:hypothetical protein